MQETAEKKRARTVTFSAENREIKRKTLDFNTMHCSAEYLQKILLPLLKEILFHMGGRGCWSKSKADANIFQDITFV